MIQGRKIGPVLLLVALCRTVHNLASPRTSPIHCQTIKKFILAKNCAELYNCGHRISGVYTIDRQDGSGPFNVLCDQLTDGGGWTVLQTRQHSSVNFTRTLADYKHGFGNFLPREVWLGLNKIYRLTRDKTKNRLRVELGVTANKTVYAEYAWFGIGDESSSYQLNIGNLLKATVGDSLSAHNNTLFGACNDVDEANHWWYIHNESNAGCGFLANLNGVISLDGKEKADRIHWAFLNSSNAGNNSPIKTEMKIRPVDFS